MSAVLKDGLSTVIKTVCPIQPSAPPLKRKAQEPVTSKAEYPTLIAPSSNRVYADSEYESEVLDLTVCTTSAVKASEDTQPLDNPNTALSCAKSPPSPTSPHCSSTGHLGITIPMPNGLDSVTHLTTPWCPVFPVMSASLGYDPLQITAFNPTDLSNFVQRLGFGGSSSAGPMSLFDANVFTAGLSLVPGMPSSALNLPSTYSLSAATAIMPFSRLKADSSPRCSSSKHDVQFASPREPLNLNISSEVNNIAHQAPWPTCNARNGDRHFPSSSSSFPSKVSNSPNMECAGSADLGHQLTLSVPTTERREEVDALVSCDQFQMAAKRAHTSEEYGGRSATNSPVNGMEYSDGFTASDSFAFGGPNSDGQPPSKFDDSPDGAHAPWSMCNQIRKYMSYEECGTPRCQSSTLREHYHCRNCNKIIIRREEMIRHAKWHRKREESLQYGFMRYSPADNCAVYNCVHNGRQTHYHCMKANCTKVYISTSDVQMHANFHRKDAVIIQEGFQRFRASETCGVQTCPFYEERTTHFHCRRANCRFTFKNKSDMDKHKMHHQKNDSFAKDGFRKYIKCENCDYTGCKYSGIINHIHCLRPGCDYVVHSSSQILSHKRKHDRRFSQLVTFSQDTNCSDFVRRSTGSTCSAFGRSDGHARNRDAPDDYLSQSAEVPLDLDLKRSDSVITNEPQHSGDRISPTGTYSLAEKPAFCEPKANSVGNDLFYELSRLTTRCIQRRKRSPNTVDVLPHVTAIPNSSISLEFLFPNDELSNTPDDVTHVTKVFELVRHYFRQYSSTAECEHQSCQTEDELSDAHWHCYWPGCSVGPYCRQTGSNYCSQWIIHIWQAALLRCGLIRCDRVDFGCELAAGLHLHCYFWPACDFTAAHTETQFISIYAHIIQHDARLSSRNAEGLGTDTGHPDELMEDSGVDTLDQTPRRRGRPPKRTKCIRVPRLNVPDELCADDARVEELRRDMFIQQAVDVVGRDRVGIVCGVKHFPAGIACPDDLCEYSCRGSEHYHCIRPRCFMSTDNLDLMNVHRREFHNHIIIAHGFEHFDRSVDCRRPTCHSKKMTQHYHCTYPNCDYAFIRPTTMTQHARKHEELARTRHHPGALKKVKWMLDRHHRRPPLSAPSSHYRTEPDSRVEFEEPRLPCLPLGMSPMAVAHLPALFPGSGDATAYRQQVSEVTAPKMPSEDRLPGFLPVWAAAMAAATAVAKSATSDSTMLHPSMSLSFHEATRFGIPESSRIGLDCLTKDVEETSVGV